MGSLWHLLFYIGSNPQGRNFPTLSRSAGSPQPSIPPSHSAAVSVYFSICYRRVPARFDGISFPGETAPSSLMKGGSRSDELNRATTLGTEPPQDQTAHRSGQQRKRPRLVGFVRQSQGVHAPISQPAPGNGTPLPLPT